MKRVLLSADSEISVYSVANEVADNLEKYCSEFRCHWLYESPDAGKYRTKIGDTVVVCYSEKEYIETALYLISTPNTGLFFVYCSICCGFSGYPETVYCVLSLICRLNLQ